MNSLRNLSIKAKIILIVGVSVLGFAVFGVFSYWTLNQVKIGSTAYYDIKERRLLFANLNNPTLALSTEVVTTYKMLSETDPAKLQMLVESARNERPNFEKAWDEQLPKVAEGPFKESLKTKVYQTGLKYFEIRERELIPALLAKDEAKALSIAQGTMRAAREDHEKGAAEALKEASDQNKAAEETAISTASTDTLLLVVIALVVMTIVGVLGYFIAQSILGPLAQVVDRLKTIAKGDASQTLEYKSADEIGALAESFRTMREVLRDLIAEMQKVSTSARNGDIRARCDASRFEGAFAEMLGGTNELLEVVGGRVKVAADRVERLRGLCITNLGTAVQKLSEGDIDHKIVTGTEYLEDKSPDAVGDLARSIDGIITQTKSTVASFEATRDTLRSLIGETSSALGRLADKDLTAKINGDYAGKFTEIKTAFNATTDNLDETMQQIIVGAEQVAAASGQISAGSQSLAQGASEQASTIEEVSSSLQEIAAMSKQNAANSTEARSMSDNARQSAERGMQSMEQLTGAIERIKNSSDSTARIVKTIEEIAFQTNLLALNAAVEAARAGDAGKGFAVVAEEVRNLAMRSAEAAKQTAELIEEAVSNTGQGVELNAEVSQKLGEINAQIEKVTIVVSEIAAASEQQNLGVEQINVAIEQMNSVTQQSAANSEESASAAEELSGQSQEMLSMVEAYTLSVKSRRGFSKPKDTHAAKPSRPAVVPTAAVNPTGGNFKARSIKKTNGKNGSSFSVDPEVLIPFGDDDNTAFNEF